MKPSLVRLALISLGFAASLSSLPAQAQKTVDQCASTLKARGYNVYKMDIDDGRIDDLAASINNQKYEIKTDMNCKVLLEKIDY